MASNNVLSYDTTRELNFELLIMRVACALPFIYHGCQILLGKFGGPGPVNFAAYMKMPAVVGYLVGLAQLAGGIAILSGFLIRIGAVCTIIVMAGAVYLVHYPHGYNIGNNGMEYALTELLLSLGLLLSGAGKFSLGRILPASLQSL
jgi:putative oxidoreductase